MPVDPTLKELCELLLTATQNGAIHWERGIAEQIVTGKIGSTLFLVNADEPMESQLRQGELDAWLISLTVFSASKDPLYSVTLDGKIPSFRESIALLLSVWKAAREQIAANADYKLRPFLDSLRAAVGPAIAKVT